MKICHLEHVYLHNSFRSTFSLSLPLYPNRPRHPHTHASFQFPADPEPYVSFILTFFQSSQIIRKLINFLLPALSHPVPISRPNLEEIVDQPVLPAVTPVGRLLLVFRKVVVVCVCKYTSLNNNNMKNWLPLHLEKKRRRAARGDRRRDDQSLSGLPHQMFSCCL